MPRAVGGIGASPRTPLGGWQACGTELLVIDADTTTRGFAREIRWNQAYFRLAEGL